LRATRVTRIRAATWGEIDSPNVDLIGDFRIAIQPVLSRLHLRSNPSYAAFAAKIRVQFPTPKP